MIAIAVITTIIYLLVKPSRYHTLTNHTWCVTGLSYNNLRYQPSSYGMKISGAGFCDEELQFETDGTVTLPGFNSRVVNGSWTLDGNFLTISKADTFGFLYNGVYDVDISKDGLTLWSDSTTIYCSGTGL